MYQTILKDKPTAYILMLALLPTCNTLLLMWFVRICRETEGDEDKHLDRFSLVSVVIAAYLMVIIILDNALSLPSSARICTLVILLVLLTSPFYVAMKAHPSESSDSRRISGISFSGHQIDDSKLLAAEIHSDSRHAHSGYHEVPSGTVREVDTNKIDKTTSQWGENLNLAQAICTSGFWLLFVASACGMGSGLATVNNISQIGASLGYTNSETNNMVSLWSIWNFVGRFGAGYLSEYFLHVNGWARPLFMTITLATMSIGHAVIASAFPGGLYIGSVLVGICYGSQWSLMPTIVSEIFGVVHMGTIFNTIATASPIGSYILSVRVIGYIYDVEASVEGGNICSGTHCFRLSFFIMSSATLLGSLAALILFFLTKDFYQQVILRRLLLHSVKE